MLLEEKTLKTETIYKGRKFSFCSDDVLLPNGDTSKRDYIKHPGGVTVAALNDKNELYFVKQFRYPFMGVVTELPAGTLEINEDPLEAGKRELREETGIVGGEYYSLGEFYPSTGYTNEIIYLYYTRVKEIKNQNLDEDEFINVVKIPLKEAYQMVLKGELKDGKSQAAILKLVCAFAKDKCFEL